jgi:hypothetical protein
MMIAIWILVFLILVLVAILLAPLRIQIDSDQGIYEVTWGHVVRMSIFPVDLKMRLSLFGMRKEWPLVSRRDRREKKAKSKKRRGPAAFSGMRFLRVLRTFRVREWVIDIDTDDYCRNAYLYPVFHFLNLWKGQWRVNYEGEFVVRLTVDNRLSRILGALLLPSLKNRKINFITQ